MDLRTAVSGPRTVALALAVALLACGGAHVAPTDTAAARVAPTGPVPSALHAAPDCYIRLDVALLRASPLAPVLTSAYAQSGLFARVLGASGFRKASSRSSAWSRSRTWASASTRSRARPGG